MVRHYCGAMAAAVTPRDLGLETVGLEVDQRGQIEVNKDYQTAVPHIYAAGDVIGWPALAGAAYDQGRFAASHMCGMD